MGAPDVSINTRLDVTVGDDVVAAAVVTVEVYVVGVVTMVLCVVVVDDSDTPQPPSDTRAHTKVPLHDASAPLPVTVAQQACSTVSNVGPQSTLLTDTLEQPEPQDHTSV